MKESSREQVLKQSWEIHDLVESRYLDNLAKKGDREWQDKQRILLADMAIHLMQTALNPGDIDLGKLRNNIHSVLTIADQFIPDAELKAALDKIYAKNL